MYILDVVGMMENSLLLFNQILESRVETHGIPRFQRMFSAWMKLSRTSRGGRTL